MSTDLNEELSVKEINSLHLKSHKKPKLVKTLIAFLAIAFVATLLVGFFKFNLSKKDVNIIDTKSFTEVRKLVAPYNESYNYYYMTLEVFNKTIKLDFKYGCQGETAFGYLEIKTNERAYHIGGKKNINSLGVRRWHGELDLFTFPFEKIPGIGMTLMFGGSVIMSTSFDEKKNLIITVSCNLLAKTKVTSGFDKVNSITGGASGTLLSGEFNGILDSSIQHVTTTLTPYRSIKIYAEGKDLNNKDFKYEFNPPIHARY